MTTLARVTDDRPAAPLTGVQKALLFLVSIDESAATRLLAHLDRNDVALVRAATESLTEVAAPAIASVHEEFVSLVRAGVPTSLSGSSSYLRRLAGKALGEGLVAELWQEQGNAEGPVAQLAELDPKTLASLLQNEHPQTRAVILTQMDSGKAAEILGHSPPHEQAEVVLRMARLSEVPEDVIHGIERQFASELELLGGEKRRRVDGIKAASGLVKRLASDDSDTLLEELASLDDAVANKLRENMFVFEDLLRVDGRGMQALLKEIATDQLVIALKGASEHLREKIFGNVSSRAANMLRDELDMLGPVRLSDVEESQRVICGVALKLEQDGRIQIAREGSSDYV